MASKDLFSGVALTLRLSSHAEKLIAHTKCKKSVNGVMLNRVIGVKKNAVPVAPTAAAEVKSVRLNHLGVVSRRRLKAIATRLFLLGIHVSGRTMQVEWETDIVTT